MILTEKIAKDLFYDDYNEEEWELVEEEEEHYKHATRFLHLYFKHFPSNTFWCVHGTIDPEWGREYCGFFEVEPAKITIVKYLVK